MTHRYRPFSHSHLLHDEPIPKCGSTVIVFLEPKGFSASEGCPSSSAED